MTISMLKIKGIAGAAAMSVAILMGSGSLVLHAQGGQNDAQIQSDLAKSLSKKKFSGIQTSVQGGVVTLTGSVDVYSDKEDADRRAHHVKGVVAVRDGVEVGGANVPDEVLRQKLSEKLVYVSVGYGTTAFNAFKLGVQNGVVTVGGVAYSPSDKDMAMGVIRNYPGVKDVIDEIEVAPTSPMDDQTRMAVARAVYGFGPLTKYSIDPAKPIRIVVINGHVTLEGVVNNKADRDMANIRANGVPNVFSVKNNLQVAGEHREK